jgi:hypothetical protein
MKAYRFPIFGWHCMIAKPSLTLFLAIEERPLIATNLLDYSIHHCVLA